MLLGGLRRRADQLEVGLDHRRSPQRDARIPFVVEPPRELVPLGGGGPLDPLDPPDRACGGAGEDEAPARQAPFLRLGVEQRERQHAAGDDRGQPAASKFVEDPDRAVAVRGVDDADALECGGSIRAGMGEQSSQRPGVLGRVHPVGGGARAEAQPSQRAPNAERDDDREPFVGGAAADRRERDDQRGGEEQDAEKRSGGRRCAVEHDDRRHRPGTHRDRLAAADLPEDAAPLEWPEAVGEPLVAHEASSVRRRRRRANAARPELELGHRGPVEAGVGGRLVAGGLVAGRLVATVIGSAVKTTAVRATRVRPSIRGRGR